MPEKLTREELELAAYHRFAGGCTWEQAAEKIHVSVKTLRAWRKKPLWRVVTEKIIAELRDDGSAEAWGCLMRACRANDVSAAKEVLARLDGPVSQRVEHTGDGGGPLRVEHGTTTGVIADPGLRALAAEIVGRASSGPPEPCEPGAADESRPVADGASPEAAE